MDIKVISVEKTIDSGLVCSAHWNASESVDGVLVSFNTITHLPPKDPADPDFIPFENLSLDVVVDWIKAELGAEGLTKVENRLKGMAELKKEAQTEDALPAAKAV